MDLKKDRKNLIIIGGVIVIFFLLVFAIPNNEVKPLGNDKGKEIVKEKETVKISSDGTMSWDLMETTFMGGCNEGGGNEPYCQCCFDYLQENYSRDEIGELSSNYLKTSEMPKELITGMVGECIDKINLN